MRNTLASSSLLCGATLLLFTACTNGTDTKTADAAHPHDSISAMNHTPTTDAGGMAAAMNGMMEKMHGMKMTGDPDRDFAEMMIVHHQGAIDMAKAELASGKDTAIRSMASGIVAAQDGEIAEMRRIVSSLPEPPANPAVDPATDPLMKSMNGMMDAGHNAQPTGDVDKDFVRMMIPHHEGAVAMAKVQMQQGRNAELKRMAQKMIGDQTREIGQLKSWLVAHP